MILCQKRRALSVRLRVSAVTFFLAIIERCLKSKACGPIASSGTIVGCSFWRYSNTPEQLIAGSWTRNRLLSREDHVAGKGFLHFCGAGAAVCIVM